MSISRGSEWRQWDLHVHTASSYDYKYRGDDADELLVKAWKENNIEAVAITDHFLIDNERIKKLREMVNGEIVIFPGVELRVDKAAKNLHVILIFPETEDVDKLSIDFNAMMLDRNAKAKESMDTIHWDFNDVIEYAKTKRGIISLHTGRKANSVDKCITNKTPFEIAIKKEIFTVTGIFEMGQIRDIDGYNDHVIPTTGELPMIICSDNHDPRDYCRKEIVRKYKFNKVTNIIRGGKERQDSVYNGILALNEKSDIVLTHDGARPFVKLENIEDGIKGVVKHGACVIGVPVTDTIKVVGEENNINNTPQRSLLWAAQTPQCFFKDIT